MVDHRQQSDPAAIQSSSFTLKALPTNFSVAQDMVREFLEPCSCKMRTLLELDMLIEEVFINIAHYAYPNGEGDATIELSLNDAKDTLCMTFRDKGIPYNPLLKESPDITSDANSRAIGGLGIFLVQKYADGLSYERKDNENRFTICKKIV